MFSAEFEAERDLKIDRHLAKLWATVWLTGHTPLSEKNELSYFCLMSNSFAHHTRR